jgi:hypothetical protein
VLPEPARNLVALNKEAVFVGSAVSYAGIITVKQD